MEVKINLEAENLNECFGMPDELQNEILRELDHAFQESQNWAEFMAFMYEKFKDQLDETQTVYLFVILGDFKRFYSSQDPMQMLQSLLRR